jgi:uncharacterized protein YggE
MPSTVTVSLRSVALAVAMAVAVLGAHMVGGAQSGTSIAAAADDTATGAPATIVMNGTGEATGVPDQLTFELAVSRTAGDVSAALHASSSTTRHVFQAVQQSGVARRDIQTTGLSVKPVYSYPNNGAAVISGYNVTQSMSVLVRSLPDAGKTMTAAVKAGGNASRLHDVRLQISDEAALQQRARADAIDQAKLKAEQYAAAAGRDLGEVTSVREVHASSTIAPTVLRAAAADVGGSVPIRAGSSDLRVTVKVVWAFA